MPLAFVNSRRRMLLCGHLGDMFEPEKELPIPEGAATMVRYDSRICAADGEQYKLIFLDNGSMIPLFPYDRSLQNPVVAVFGEGEFVLVTATPQGLGLGVFISQNGEPVRGTLEWTAIPKSLAFHFPYVAALLNNNTIEIHNVMTQQRVQSLTLPPNVDSRFLAEATFNLDVNTTGGSSTSSGGTIRILIGCKNCVLALTMTPLASQVDQLLEQRDVERALELAEHMMLAQPDESALRKKTQMEHLYRRAALLHFQDTLFDEALGLLKKGATDPAFLTSWFPDIADHTEGLDVDMSEKHPEYPATSDAIVNAYLSKEYADADPETLTSFGEALFGNAQSMLGEYLRYARTIYPVDDPRQEHIDMTLLKLYIKTDPARLASFLSSPTRCRMADAEALLEAQKRYYDLSLLHKTRGMNENVLDMWHRLAVGEIEDPAFPGLETVCEYVKALEHRDIVMSAVEWVLRLDRGLAIGILVHHMDKTMSMGDIEAYLKEREPEAYVEFVERLVFGREEQDPNLHTTLALLYLTTLQSLATPSSLTSLDTAYLSLPTRPTYRSFLLSRPSDRLCVERAKLLNFLDTSAHIDYGVVAERVEAVEGLKAERAVVMTKQGGDKDAEAVVKLWLEVGDDVSAEACAVAQPVPETRGRLLRVLLEHCMRDEGGDPQQHMKAIGLLNRHATHFDLLSILPALPTTWSLRLLAPHFIASALRSSVHAHRTSVITKNVAKGMHLKTHAVLLDERQARVAVHLPEGGVRCCVCEKGVTDPTVFARWEDGRVTHVHCVGRGESTR
ncbi:vacuolar sorting protein 39 domain 2-domain-containing protein [Fimicolochytrium jonesii]|uniref:vacuolar sorting protein 39 domain 2-domain-containing protein n=1 Tax=Fimicolochytrium jonesii TaxID=1396493 RepID=UPI0022FDE2C1|nr:vacuolar sorting protein 39 domain 2-domain-containing protein [Fimicolochytrium jonesii]KAI8819120.1 vacuolar sorting protein 39 domain 2-domain-containing protein [Fimicolochytrium jonesii]